MHKSRGRPKKQRIIKNLPKTLKFSPRGRPGRPDEIELKIEEFEALRLADSLGLKQAEAAKSMQVSQQTFSRILKRARKNLAAGITGAKIIRIQSGS